jgi:CrcB protein
MTVLGVLIAGVIGAVLRYLVTRSLGTVGVLAVNVVGSGVAGVLVALTTGDLRLILLTGLCGGLTTFSTFSVDTVQLVLAGRAHAAALNVAANLLLGVGAAALGFGLGVALG